MGLLPASRTTDYIATGVQSERALSGGLQRLGWLAVALLILMGLGFSLLLAAQPLYAAALVIAAGGLFVFLRNFEQAVLGILMLRSVLDMYSAQSIPAVFAIGVDLLVFLYLGRQIIFRQKVNTDPFWWFLLIWVMLQSIWVVLLAADGLGGTQFMAYEAAREWTRLFSLAMVYLLVMQLRDRISPEKLATLLVWSAAIPIALAMLQALPIELPGFLQSNVSWTVSESEVTRINSTLGHYNSFATFSLLFLALALWRVQMAKKPLGWILLAAGLLYCLLLSKSITGIVMLVVFSIAYFVPKLRGKGLVGAAAVGLMLTFLLSSDLAQSRLLELNQTPLLNPEISISRAIALQAADMDEFRNSFNWRLVQWRNLLIDWQAHPILGYGLASAEELSVFNTTPHNDYIRFLVEEGIVGFSLFLLFLMAQVTRLIQIMRQSLPNSSQRALSQTMFAFMLSMLVGMLAGNVMVHTATFFYWWTLMALLGWSWTSETDSPYSEDAYTQEGLFEDELYVAQTDRFGWEQAEVPIVSVGDIDRYNYIDGLQDRGSADCQAFESGRYSEDDYRASAYLQDEYIHNDGRGEAMERDRPSAEGPAYDDAAIGNEWSNPADVYVYRPTDTYLLNNPVDESLTKADD